jgi:hypothetical protein
VLRPALLSSTLISTSLRFLISFSLTRGRRLSLVIHDSFM